MLSNKEAVRVRWVGNRQTMYINPDRLHPTLSQDVPIMGNEDCILGVLRVKMSTVSFDGPISE
jgi:hypothetical protein